MKNKIKVVPLDRLNDTSRNTMLDVLNIRFTHLDEDSLTAEMPVDKRTHQPFGILHGGASAALAETLGSVGAMLCVDEKAFHCVGLELNANHIGSISSGFVVGVGKPIHIGKRTQVWDIRITEKGSDRLICVSRLTLAVLANAKG